MEQNSQRSRKATISQKEEEFLLKVLQSKNVPTRLQNLCEAAKDLYGQQYNQLVARSSVGDLNVLWANVEVEDEGEKNLLEKVTSHLKTLMERHHYSISQMVYNMERLGG